jgi:hypothetical protein
MNAFLSRLWTRLCGRLNFQEQVTGPVIVNLVTGLILFVVLATGKNWIYPLILPRASATDYPIYASAEAFNLPTGEVAAEIYVTNLTRESFSDSALRKWLEENKGINPNAADDRVIVEWRRADGGLRLSNDEPFNAGKGKLEITRLSDDGRKWSIRIKDINARALLRVKVQTEYTQPISRADQAGLPFTVETPRGE